MAKKLIGDTISAKCTYCEYCILTEDPTIILCEKRGLTDLENACNKFRYDALKRAPRRPAPLQEFQADEFKL